MATELELKLMVQPEYLKSVCAFLDEFCEKSLSHDNARQPTLDLMNGYYDTSDAKLMKNGIAMRIRAVNQQYIQTVKTKGSSRIGMHERGEWEWQISTDSLDLSLLKEVPLPDSLADMSWSHDLIEVFRTDFKRKVWNVVYDGALIEVVCDQGDVTSQFGRDVISELELELKSGPELSLYAFAKHIANSLPVQVSTVSKAQKGARLKHRRIEFPSKPAKSDSLLVFAAYWYETWLTYWEALFYLNDEALIQPILTSLVQLQKCVPGALSRQLAALERDYEALFDQDDDALLAKLAGGTQTGVMMLETGLWLNRQLD
ncbi:CYTH domain-containing protein [Marinomonas piezotolerans]|uniref:CYTH domain-containing protein n=1 Tax=Marinomonas piezotolerans TaxID=2213058 RepID=A0A370U926_9GAMM|nr:CYTH domain-containing protein [Marinomonas piezotolerans]RDL44277.1 CYTH domain-containing protein [Marinomonas piezotolerans]